MLSSFLKGVQQLADKDTRKPLWLSVGLAMAIFIALWVVCGTLIRQTQLFEWGWLETITDALGGAFVLVLTWVLFPGVVSAIVSLFLERVAECVERVHYPELGPAPGQPLAEGVKGALKFLAVLVFLNVLILPFILTGPLYAAMFYAVNGYLLGREYFELVAARRLAAGDVAQIRRARGKGVFFTGLVIAFLLTIPLVNLLTPVIATAAMVHQFERWRHTPLGGSAGGHVPAKGDGGGRALTTEDT